MTSLRPPTGSGCPGETDRSIDRVASDAGFGTAGSLRQHIAALAAEFTAAHPTMDPGQQRLVLAALRLLAEGQPFRPAELAARLGLPTDEVASQLAELHTVQRDEQERVVAMFGLTLKQTSHSLVVDGRTLYAWCALDTLFLPELLGRPARIRSVEPGSGQTVTLEVDGTEVRDVSPAGAALTLHDVAGFDLKDVIGTFCCFVHFFASEEAANTWVQRNPGGYVVSIADGFEYGRHYNHNRFKEQLDSPAGGRQPCTSSSCTAG